MIDKIVEKVLAKLDGKVGVKKAVKKAVRILEDEKPKVKGGGVNGRL